MWRRRSRRAATVLDVLRRLPSDSRWRRCRSQARRCRLAMPASAVNKQVCAMEQHRRTASPAPSWSRPPDRAPLARTFMRSCVPSSDFKQAPKPFQ